MTASWAIVSLLFVWLLYRIWWRRKNRFLHLLEPGLRQVLFEEFERRPVEYSEVYKVMKEDP